MSRVSRRIVGATTTSSTWIVTGLAVILIVGFAAAEGLEESLGQLPDLRVVGWSVVDSPDGNGDGGLHPGETAFVEIYLANRGNEPAFNVVGTLSERIDHPDIEILDKVALWPDLPATGTPAASAAPSFSIRVATTRPCGWEIPLELALTAADGYAVQRTLSLFVSDRQVVDLATRNARPLIFGADNFDILGSAVTTGDLDGDGFDDLIAGAPFSRGLDNAEQSGAGEVAIVYGGPTNPADIDIAAPPEDVAMIYNSAGTSLFGRAVSAGDFNGDGFDDVLISATFADQVFVVYGAAVRLSDTDLGTLPANVTTISGTLAGFALSSGDLDGDGFDEVIVGSDSSFLGQGLGAAVIYGGPGQLPDIDLSLPPSNVAFITGDAESVDLGFSVAAGDADGDGFDDLVVGDPTRGDVIVVYGGPSRLESIDLADPPSNVGFVTQADPFDVLGWSLAVGDLDADGFDELVLGAFGGDGPGNGRAAGGEVAIVYGASTRISSINLASPPPSVSVVYGAQDNDVLGWVVGVGDLDGDGFEDLLMGAPGADGPDDTRASSGEVFVVHGGARLPDLDLASAPPQLSQVFAADSGDSTHSIQELDVTERYLATGDLDGDGFDELIVGFAGADGPRNVRTKSGEVAVIRGAPRVGYRHDADGFAFIDASIGTNVGLACDDCSAGIPLGFDFDFFGQTYDSVTVSSNGYLSFDGSADQPAGFCPPASNPTNNLIAPFWDDLNPATGGGVFYLLEGIAPDRRLTVEWAGVPLYPATGDATFEVTLFEGSNQILFQYQDVTFGNGSDNGATAVVGVENITGVNGVAVSCLAANVAEGSAVRLRRFASPTVVFKDDVESGDGIWTPSGLWHRAMEPDCSPSSRSGDFSWYYGQDTTCDFDTGTGNAGTLLSDPFTNLPQDAALTFWQRREAEDSPDRDDSLLQYRIDFNIFTLARVTENSNQWRFSDDFLLADPQNGVFQPLDLSFAVGQDVEFGLTLNTISASENNFLGWMVDDISIHACPVFEPGGGPAAAAEARATPQPAQFCEGSEGRLDALGSYCTACDNLDYQWTQDGALVPGATDITYTVPAAQPPGSYDFAVRISCPNGFATCVDESNIVDVGVVVAPVAVGPSVRVGLVNDRTQLEFVWADVAGAESYSLFSDTDPAGGFAEEIGSSSSGNGIQVSTPSETRVFYLVAGRNPTCGVGPLR